MGKLTVGSVVLVTFPFSDLKGQMVRPALILAKAEFNNYILCQITSKPYSSKIAIKIDARDFANGGLPVISFVRVDKLFTADKGIIRTVAGELTPQSKKRIIRKVKSIF